LVVTVLQVVLDSCVIAGLDNRILLKTIFKNQ